MNTTTHTTTKLLAGAAIAVLCSLAACGKKHKDTAEEEEEGPQSTQGAILESVQKTADEANERSRKVKEQMDKARE